MGYTCQVLRTVPGTVNLHVFLVTFLAQPMRPLEQQSSHRIHKAGMDPAHSEAPSHQNGMLVAHKIQ